MHTFEKAFSLKPYIHDFSILENGLKARSAWRIQLLMKQFFMNAIIIMLKILKIETLFLLLKAGVNEISLMILM